FRTPRSRLRTVYSVLDNSAPAAHVLRTTLELNPSSIVGSPSSAFYFPTHQLSTSSLRDSPVPRPIGEVYVFWRNSHGDHSTGSANGRTIDRSGDRQRNDDRGLFAITVARTSKWFATSTVAWRARCAPQREQF